MHYINGNWVKGNGNNFISTNPANREKIWQGNSADNTQINHTVLAAKDAFNDWRNLSLQERVGYIENFLKKIETNKVNLYTLLSQENGKPLWESKNEISGIINKLSISLESYNKRCVNKDEQSADNTIAVLKHRPHGVCAIYAPFNFPCHLANGHIIPALLAGNTIILKPSELTPAISEKFIQCWHESGIPSGVINMLQGDKETGIALANHPELNGIFFTGSSKVGMHLQNINNKFPKRILVLEMGGNNPLILDQVVNIKAAIYNIIQSVFITSGQRCTCTRRLIVIKSEKNNEIIKELIKATKNIKVGSFDSTPEPFMGPVISNFSAERIMLEYQNLIKNGAEISLPLASDPINNAFLYPGIVNITGIKNIEDKEIFGPLLQIIYVDNLDQAITEANNTKYGLSSGILTDNEKNFRRFYTNAKAGIINWNRPTTGSNSNNPFGGIGLSGNYHPTASYAADYCVYPVASLQQKELSLPEKISPGIKL